MKNISESDLQFPQKKWGELPVLGLRPRTDEFPGLKTDGLLKSPPHFFKVPSRDRWNPAHFGEMPRQLDSEGNPLIFWDDSIEPPEPDDYDTLAEYEEAWEKWEKEYSDSLTCAAELEPVSPSVESLPEKYNYADSVKSTRFVKKSCKNGSLACQSTMMCRTSELRKDESTLLPHHRRVSLSALKGIEGEKPTNEIVSRQFCDLLLESNPNFSASKTYPDYCRLPNTQEINPEHIFNRCSGSFMNAGTMWSGLLSERDFTSEPNGREKGSYSLPRPGALSWSGKGRPPGNTKSEAKAKKLGLIGKKEVFNPEWLELQFGLPIGWTSPQEHRAAIELIAIAEQHLEIV